MPLKNRIFVSLIHVVGKKVSQGLLSWKGADLTWTFYVRNADINNSVDDMKAGIEQQGP